MEVPRCPRDFCDGPVTDTRNFGHLRFRGCLLLCAFVRTAIPTIGGLMPHSVTLIHPCDGLYQLILWHRTGSDSYQIFKSWFCKNLTEVFAILNQPIRTLVH